MTKHYGTVTCDRVLVTATGSLKLSGENLDRLIGCEVLLDGEIKNDQLFFTKWTVLKEKPNELERATSEDRPNDSNGA